jgi:hypothetical protein
MLHGVADVAEDVSDARGQVWIKRDLTLARKQREAVGKVDVVLPASASSMLARATEASTDRRS